MGKRVRPAGSGRNRKPVKPVASRAGAHPAKGMGRRETPLERNDRNWTDILQELRVLQTGIQILTGFLLTLPFQPRFSELSRREELIYLCLVVLSALITALIMSTIVMHRTFFQRRIKPQLVRNSDILLRITIMLVGLTLVGTLGLVFDLVLGMGSGAIAGIGFAVFLIFLWGLLPYGIRRRALLHRRRR